MNFIINPYPRRQSLYVAPTRLPLTVGRKPTGGDIHKGKYGRNKEIFEEWSVRAAYICKRWGAQWQ
jgi:hypothetical protein